MRRLSKYTLFAALLVLAVLPLSGSAATTRAHVASHSAKAAFC
jgi:hypothetical protein